MMKNVMVFIGGALPFVTLAGYEVSYAYENSVDEQYVLEQRKRTTSDYHVVQQGETLSSIAHHYGYDYQQLAAWNLIQPPYIIYPRQRLRVVPHAGAGAAHPPAPAAKEYVKLKQEVDTHKTRTQLLLERETPSQQELKQATTAVPQVRTKQAEENHPATLFQAQASQLASESSRDEDSLATEEDRQKEAEEAKRELDEFLRQQKVLFKAGEIGLEFGAFYSHETAVSFPLPDEPFGLALAPKFISRSVNTSLLVRYGLANDLEFDFQVPFVYIAQEADFSDFASVYAAVGADVPQLKREVNLGLGDVSGALRYAAWHEDGSVPEVSLSINFKPPTGDRGRSLGSGHWNVGGSITLVKTIDPVVLFGSVGYTWTVERGRLNPGDQIPYSMGMGFSLNDRVSFSTALAGTTIRPDEVDGKNIRPSGLDINTLQFGVTIQVAKRLFFEPVVGFGITEAATDFFVGINVPYRLEGQYPLPFFHN
jgi:FOG: LysM repeat